MSPSRQTLPHECGADAWVALSLCIFGIAAVASALQGYLVRQCICDSLLLAIVWPVLIVVALWRKVRGSNDADQ